MKILVLLGASVLLLWEPRATAQTVIPLAGEWQFAADPTDIGIAERWYARSFTETVRLPGSMTANGKGDPVRLSTRWTGDILDSSFFTLPRYAKYRRDGNIKIPFWLQPERTYCGPAWYQKEVHIPAGWKGKPAELVFERCHWQSSVWIDDAFIGTQNALGAPHRFDLAGMLTEGIHTVTVRVDNRINDIDPGVNSSSLTDNTQTNWNGIVGAMTLTCRETVNIRSLHIFPDARRRTVRVTAQIENRTRRAQGAAVTLLASPSASIPVRHRPLPGKKTIRLQPGLNRVVLEYDMGKEALLWDEFSPNLYTMTCSIAGRGIRDSIKTVFGLRTLGTRGTQFTVNDRTVFLRGTLECAIFPRTGYPPVDAAEWTRIFRACRRYGLNHVRFHSWCPPEAAFTAADSLGIYLLVECSSWANPGTSIGDGKPIDRYIMEEESRRIVDAFGNHPSFCFLAYGNEPAGGKLKQYLTDFIRVWKQRDNRRLYCGASGWPVSDSSDFHVSYKPRIQHWEEGLKSIINSQAPSTTYDWSDYIRQFTVPVVGHEIGEWCAYPDFSGIPKYDGVLRARSLELFRESLIDSGMGALARPFLEASGKLQVLCYKADIEAALRTKGMGGFQLLDLHDFPGQGSALVGVLDPFWETKGYVTPEEYREFCSATVVLARMPRLIYTTDDTLEASIEVAHYGDQTLTGVIPSWRLIHSDGSVSARGEFAITDIPAGGSHSLGVIRRPLVGLPAPAMYTLEVRAGEFANRWHVWVYPDRIDAPADARGIRVVRRMDDTTMAFLSAGGSVLLTPAKGTVARDFGGDIAVGFSSIFWNTAWTAKQPPHTLGLLCDPAHPLLAGFPTQYHSNYQWWDAMSHSSALRLSALGAGLQPVVRLIDDWFTNRPLALILEARVGKGRIVISGVDLLTDAERRPEARQLLGSILGYMGGEAFDPAQEIEARRLVELSPE